MADERELTREEKIAQARERVEALKRQRAAAAAAGAPAGAAPAKAAEVPVSAANPAGRPVEGTQGKTVRVVGTVNQAVDIIPEAGDAENLKKLLTGISGYPNPLRRGAVQLDYRYYAEARRRLEGAGYTIEEVDYMGRPVREWTPHTRGWTRVEPLG